MILLLESETDALSSLTVTVAGFVSPVSTVVLTSRVVTTVAVLLKQIHVSHIKEKPDVFKLDSANTGRITLYV